MSEDNVSYWADRWVNSQTGWHIKGGINPQLDKFWDTLFSSPQQTQATVLFPLCGKTYDMTAVAERGYSVVGIEGVQQALDEYAQESQTNLVPVNDNVINNFSHIKLANNLPIDLYLGDFFAWPQPSPIQVDYVLDRGSFVAIEPKNRLKYISVINSILKSGGKILLLAMEFDTQYKTGPPNCVTEDDIKECIEYLQKTFHVEYTYKYLQREKASVVQPKSRWLTANGGPLPDYDDIAVLLEKK